jgi:UDP-N-acetylglucosamine acyltransferase
MKIHPSAVVSPRAELASGVEIGPYCVVGDHVTIGLDTILESHVVIQGHTRIGEKNRIEPFVSIGSPPQDVGYQGEDTRVIIGDENIIKEYTTINRATTKENWETIVGNNNYFMAYSHVAHDCLLGDHIIMSNVATLGGHVHVGNYATVGAMVAAHQFLRIGAYAFLGAKSGLDRDVPPYMITAGSRAKLYGPNQKGLNRLGFAPDIIDDLKKAYKIIWRDNKSFAEGISQVRREVKSSPELGLLLDFFNDSKRGILR